ncbi:MAG: glycosyltransferase family 2 protein [Candidatus Poseidoniales archaeon]
MNSKEPFIIVLILSYNGRELLEDSVSSYLKNSYSNFEVIVIDNGSIDGTEDYILKNFPEAKVIRLEKNRGYSGGFNYGLKYATDKMNADYMLVTNNDVIADVNLISELVNVSKKDSEAGFVTGKVYFHESKKSRNIIQTVGRFTHPINIVGEHIGSGEVDKGQYDKIEERDFIDDVFTLVSRDLVKKTNGYDETFFLEFEEADWQIRAKKLGFKIYFTPFAKLWHKLGMTTGGTTSPMRTFYLKRNQIIFVESHSDSGNFLRFF